MTKETQSILKKDLKKYQSLAEYSQDTEIYLKIVNCIEEILEEN